MTSLPFCCFWARNHPFLELARKAEAFFVFFRDDIFVGPVLVTFSDESAYSTFSFFIQVHRIKTVRAMTSSLSRSNSTASLASLVSSSSTFARRSAMAKPFPIATPISPSSGTARSFGQKLFSVLLGGEKGNQSPGYVDMMAGRAGSATGSLKGLKTTKGQENPVARLKLLLVRFFSYSCIMMLILAF